MRAKGIDDALQVDASRRRLDQQLLCFIMEVVNKSVEIP